MPGGLGTPTNWWVTPTKQTPTTTPVRIGVSSPAAINADPVYNALKSSGLLQGATSGNAQLESAYKAMSNQASLPGGYQPNTVPAAKRTATSGGSKGGGGGGGKALPQYSQAQIDWLTSLLAQSRPQQVKATNLDLPDWQGSFDPSIYNQLESQFNTAVGSDRAAAQQAYGNLNNYLTSNYQNAFNNPNATYATAGQAPGQSQQAMARMMQSQGLSPGLAAQQTEGAAAGDQAFGNLWRILAANEDTNQANRLRRAQEDAGTTQRALDIAALQGQTGIGLQRSQAQAAFQQQMAQMQNQIAQQEALQNWQRANQVTDTNAANQNSYINAQMQALLGFLPELKGTNLNMPNLTQLMSGSPNAADPYNWQGIAAGIANGTIPVPA